MSLDAVSGGEIYIALQAGFPAERIEFHGNNKSYDELDFAIKNGVGLIIADADDEPKMIDEIAKKYGRKQDILIRIAPGIDPDTHPNISTGSNSTKFGFEIDEKIIYPFIKSILELDNVNLRGIHNHIGSQIFENRGHIAALAPALSIIRGVKERFGIALLELNIGGGFAINYLPEDESKSFAYYLDPVMAEVKRYCGEAGMSVPTIIVEPGRSIVGEAGITLYTVGSRRVSPGVRSYISVDGGMTDNIRPAMYGAKYHAVLANHADEPKDEIVTICGSCCESGDMVIFDAELPYASRGDILVVFSTGAYGHVLASNYNKHLMPEIIMIEDGSPRIILRRQTFTDLIALEV
jgi:diaminopimelate decarboxylase